MVKFLREHWLFLIILAIGVFLRSYKAIDWFMYTHDQDLAGWMIKDILLNKHLRLIGQETSSHGIFIGPVFYYLLIPFYLLTKMDPAGSLILPILISVFTISSFYWVFSKVFNKEVGILAALFYSFSYFIVFIDREIVPTTPVMLWTVWFFYGLNLILKGNKYAYPLLGFLVGLIWSFNLALLILSPLILIAKILFYLRRQALAKINIKYVGISFFIFIITLSPFLAFEARHDFQQTKAVVSSLTSQKDYVPGTSTGLAKVDRVLQLVHRNTTNLYWDSVINVPSFATFNLLLVFFFFLVLTKKISKSWGVLMFSWQALYILFFSFNSLNPSEYYINGMNVVWIGILAITTSMFLEKHVLVFVGPVILGVFVFLNIWGFFHRPINLSGYNERKAITKFIFDDSKRMGYPCVSVSYITSPGYDLGYRYFFFLEGLHVNQPKSESPVYTIVFPLSKVDRVDKTFGVIGLILPDYARYTKEAVKESCSGENANLTDPMFGYTE